ncbi:hypothetical protein [Paenibacillus paeoniae]|uniref:hypothetical protein n=1 Tax=Paenibacillus paeoniae TaxID=2292705 RepID=UPI00140334C4|nr:hypothetical protein [Paenibacillus paeoniae]
MYLWLVRMRSGANAVTREKRVTTGCSRPQLGKGEKRDWLANLAITGEPCDMV